MARPVNAHPAAEITALLRAIRRELWKRRLADDTVRGFWWLAAATLALGFTHRWIWSVDPGIVAAVSGLPALIVVGMALVHGRPDFAICARRADQWFHGKEIMVSAWELSRYDEPHDSWSTEIVMSRAGDYARKWRDQLPHEQTDFRQRSVIPVSIVLAGLFLLVSPGSGSAGAVGGLLFGGTTRLSGDPAAPDIRQPPVPDRILTATASAPTGRPRRTGGSEGERSRSLGKRSDDARNPQTRGKDQPAAEMNVARAAGRGVSDQPRGREDRERTDVAPEMNIRFIDVPEREGDMESALNTGSAAQLDGREVLEKTPSPAVAKSAGPPIDTRRFNDFRPALRSYVAAYMKESANQK